MCRLLGILSVEEDKPEDWLLRSENSLLRQSNVNPEHVQGDGWGIAWWYNRSLNVVKGANGAFEPEEKPRFEAAADQATGPLVVAHLRKASNPLKLPKEELLGFDNSQPFSYGKVVFAHNGSIPLPKETATRLEKYRDEIRGVNDSEVFFYLLLESVEAERDVPHGYARAVEILKEVWEANGSPGKFAYSGLNVLFSRHPDELWGLCHYTGEHGKSIGGCDCPYYQMSYREMPESVVVSSEPMDLEESAWKPLRNGSYLYAQRRDGKVLTTTGRLAVG